jgi:hypothetical protein
MFEPVQSPNTPDEDFDYSTPEGQATIRAASAMVLQIRDELHGPLARKIALYERTLGLAVIPVLVRRLLLALWRRRRMRRLRGR